MVQEEEYEVRDDHDCVGITRVAAVLTVVFWFSELHLRRFPLKVGRVGNNSVQRITTA